MEFGKIALFFSLIIIFTLILGDWFLFSQKETLYEKKGTFEIKLGEQVILAEIADTPFLRSRGLSGRESLSEDEGMLFVYEEPTFPSFWMKDMKFPIDIVWIGEEKEIVGIEKDIPPDSYPEKYRPSSPVLYVLEVKAGFVEKNNIEIGEKVEF